MALCVCQLLFLFAEIHSEPPGRKGANRHDRFFFFFYSISLKRLLYCLWLSVASTLRRLNQKYGCA